MKTKFLAVLFLLCGQALFADEGDSYLFWMISPDQVMAPYGTVISEDHYYAKVGYANSGTDVSSQGLTGYLNLYAEVGDGNFINDAYADNRSWASNEGDGISNVRTWDSGDVLGVQSAPVFAKFTSDLTSANYSYYVELLNEAGQVAGYGSFGTYADLAGYLSSRQGAATPGMMKLPGPFLIPEPTSGMLVLLGVAGLALRRRKMQKVA